MKQLVLFSVMCLSTLSTKAQVMTSETVNNVYASVSTEDKGKFAYNGEYDDNGRLTTMTVYKKEVGRNGLVTLKPAFYYEYAYTSDGLLESRVKYVWHKDEWQRMGRYDYTLTAADYTTTYSRWSNKQDDFTAAEKMVYTLLPDSTTTYISYYQCKHMGDSLQLTWQLPVVYQAEQHNHYLTQK